MGKRGPQAAPWFRFYSEVVHDPKVQSLLGSDFKAWVNLLCLANNGFPRGSLPDDFDIAYHLRTTEGRAAALITKLAGIGLIDIYTEPPLRVMHNWDGRQYDSDMRESPGRAGYDNQRVKVDGKWQNAPQMRREFSENAPRVIEKRAANAPQMRRKLAAAEQNRTEQNRAEAEAEQKDFNIFRLGEQFYGRVIGSMEIKTLERFEEEYEPECIKHSFQEASDQNKKSFKYAEAIMKGHKERGCFVDTRPRTAEGNGFSRSGEVSSRVPDFPGFVLDPGRASEG